MATTKKKQTTKQTTTKPRAVVIRANQSGCHYGYIESKSATEIVLRDARRLWHWIGASLSQVAAEGAGAGSKIGVPVRVTLRREDVIEILDATPAAAAKIEGMTPWRK